MINKSGGGKNLVNLPLNTPTSIAKPETILRMVSVKLKLIQSEEEIPKESVQGEAN